MDIPNESSCNVSMSVELRTLETAIADFDREADDDFVDPRRLSAAIDRDVRSSCPLGLRGLRATD